MQDFSVLPALLEKNFLDIEKISNDLIGVASALQIDVVDGQFVSEVSWPFSESDVDKEWSKISLLSQSFELEVDLMVKEPARYFSILKSVGVKRVVLHVADLVSDIGRCIERAKTEGLRVALAITNDSTDLSWKEYLDGVDFVQVMGIKEVGKQGQDFDPRTLVTIRKLKEEFPQFQISVDGSVNEDTIVQLKEAGANRFAVGSSVTKAADPATSFINLNKLLGISLSYNKNY